MPGPRFRAFVFNTIVFVGLTLVALLVLWPIVYTVSSAFAPGNSVAGLSPIPFADGVTWARLRCWACPHPPCR